MDDLIKVTGEWYFQYDDGPVQGPFFNGFPAAGLAKIAECIEDFSAPYLVIGDDTDAGYVITEVFRKAVSLVSRDGAVVRYRTQLLSAEANGNHEKVSLFVEGTATAASGTMLNLLRQSWNKAAGSVVTVEVKITVQGVA